MDKTDTQVRDLKEAMHAEKDVRVYKRMMAVRGVLAGHSTKDAACFADVCQRAVQEWMERFYKYGVDGLRDLPGRGRKPLVRHRRIEKLAEKLRRMNMLTPGKLRNRIRSKLSVRYSLGSVRRILNFLGFSRKRSTTTYSSAADAETVRRWQAGAAGMIRAARRRRFRVVVQARRKWGKVLVIMDNASQHRSEKVTGYLEGNKDMEVIWLPTATPEVSATEEYWHQAKRDVLVSEYYATVVQMRRAMSEYFRTARPGLDVMKFINRKSLDLKNF